jgi:hypothetical protein
MSIPRSVLPTLEPNKTAPAPASTESRLTKHDRIEYLNLWARTNPLATIEQAREAVKVQFGLSVGTKLISDALRSAREQWETDRKQVQVAAPKFKAPVAVFTPVPQAAKAAVSAPQGASLDLPAIVAGMRGLGIRLIEVLPDGELRIKYN